MGLFNKIFGEEYEQDERLKFDENDPYNYGVISPWDYYWSKENKAMFAIPQGRDLYCGDWIRTYTKDGGGVYIPKSEKSTNVTKADYIGTFTSGYDAAAARAKTFIEQFERDGMTSEGLVALVPTADSIPAEALLYYMDWISLEPEEHEKFPGTLGLMNHELSDHVVDGKVEVTAKQANAWFEKFTRSLIVEKQMQIEGRHNASRNTESKTRTKGRMDVEL